MWSEMRSLLLVILCVASTVLPAQPFNLGRPHPDWTVEFNGQQNLPTVEVIVGLNYLEQTAWKGFYAEGILCAKWSGPPIPPTDYKVVVWPQDRPSANLDFWGQAYVGHDAGACKWFAAWSQRATDVPTLKCEFDVKLEIHHGNGDPTTVYTRHVRLRVAGGPLLIDVKQKSDNLYAFIKHRSPNPDPADNSTKDKVFPWYCTDFDYNPFDYRMTDAIEFTMPGLQRCNVFKAKPLWLQPEDVTIKWLVGGVGTFLNPNTQLEQIGSSVNPQETKPLSPAIEEWITMNGELDSVDEFLLTANFYNGTPTGPPYPNPVTTDQSGDFYKLQDELDNRSWRMGENYAKFKPHKPKIHGLHDLSDLLSPSYRYINDGTYLGQRFLYSLDDTEDYGMPGVWVQERFIGFHDGGDAIPSWFITDFKTGTKWQTRPLEYLADSRDGTFHEADTMSMAVEVIELFSPLFYHEYWAATDKSAEDLAFYPWRYVPNTNNQVKKYLGIFLESYDMDFWIEFLWGVEHNVGTRHSGDGPPPT